MESTGHGQTAESSPSSKPDDVDVEIRASHQSLLHALDLLDSSATSEAPAGVQKAERSRISRSLKQLVLMGAVRCEDFQFNPGRERGNPVACTSARTQRRCR